MNLNNLVIMPDTTTFQGNSIISYSNIDQKSKSKFDRFVDASLEGSGAAMADLGEFNFIQLEGEGRVRVEHPLPRILGSES